jgi:hypothetical protein
VVGPNELAWTEAGLAALAGTGLTAAERLDTLVLVSGHVRGIAQQTPTDAADESGFARALAPQLAEHAARFPEAVAAFREAGGSEGADEALEFGLDRILDGLESLVSRRTRQGADGPCLREPADDR